MAIVTAMHGGALRAAGRATPMIAAVMGDDEQVIGSADHLIDRAARQRTKLGHASPESPSLGQVPAARPRKARESHQSGGRSVRSSKVEADTRVVQVAPSLVRASVGFVSSTTVLITAMVLAAAL